MSNFICEHCGAEIVEGVGHYVTGCEHYPIEADLLPLEPSNETGYQVGVGFLPKKGVANRDLPEKGQRRLGKGLAASA